MGAIKNIIRNKNFVTIVGVIAILGLLYWGYSSQVKKAVDPIPVPVAAVTIQPRTKITKEMISTIEIPSIAVVENVHRSAELIIGKYTAVNTVIPVGSMFYFETIIDKSQLPDSSFIEVGEDKIPYLFSVDSETSFMNSIYPGSKIDIYMKADDENGKIMIGKLLSDLEVVAVKDASGQDVFENTEENRQAAYLIFGLDEDIHILIRKAGYLSNLGVELIPVPHGGSVTSEGETKVSTEYLRDFINANTIVLEGQNDANVDEEE